MRSDRNPIAAAAVAACLLVPSAAQPSQDSGQIGRRLAETRGVWTYFEDRGAPAGWNSGELLEAIAAPAVRAEVVLQLKQMRAMGVNEIVYEMRSSDGEWPVATAFPDCERATTLGPLWPKPTQMQLDGLRTLFDVVWGQGIRITLILNTTHMEQQPPGGNAQWLAAILGAIKDKPALDLVAFGGDRHLVDAQPPYNGVADSCGGESEAPLWLGPDSVEARYVQWAIGYARSLGIAPEKLTAEAIVGDYRHEARQGAGPGAQDRHLWPTIEVLRTIFDRLGLATSQRAYALSYYPHPKCAFVDTSLVPCTEQEQHAWSEETLRRSKSRVEPEARLTIVEFGTQSSQWTHEKTVEGFGHLLTQFGIEGGVYWQWVNPSNDPRYTHPGTDLKQRGRAFTYNPQQKELADLYGLHLTSIPNGSFEEGTAGWRITGGGAVRRIPMDEDAPWRGLTFLRLASTGSLAVTSRALRVSPRTTYTTTANLRFGRTGPYISVRFLTCRRERSAVRAQAVIRFTQATDGFDTFPLKYTTPKDACFVRIEVGTRAPATLDVDNLR